MAGLSFQEFDLGEPYVKEDWDLNVCGGDWGWEQASVEGSIFVGCRCMSFAGINTEGAPWDPPTPPEISTLQDNNIILIYYYYDEDTIKINDKAIT